MKKKSLKLRRFVKTFVLPLIIMCFSCSQTKIDSRNIKDQNLNNNNNENVSLTNHEFVSNPVNLNIVMFVPTDNPALKDYKTRLSALFVYFQNWIHTEMMRYGYSTYLGLPVDQLTGLVKIIEIPASGTQADYPYKSAISVGKIINEIKTFKTKNPAQFSSDNHCLVLLPARTDGGNQPFYRHGKFCFAVDNSEMSVTGIPNPNSNYLGGMLHELGHGLNLPHSEAKYSEGFIHGTSLMGSGNYSFSKGQPTFLTESDAAILNRNEVFQPAKSSSTPYLKPIYSLQPRFNIDNRQQKLFVNGSYTSTLPVSDILVYMDPNVNNEGTGVNKDYNAVTWRFSPQSIGLIQGTIDLNELNFKNNTPYELKIKLLLQNGHITSDVFPFQYNNGKLTTRLDSSLTFSNASY
ncbi:hypothetical protein [Sphingobacterium sp. JUb56]|uniref:hypothetical protein n=1 Tax=Sphingobacterium sp. JUb56 TaxID=2587145 RepID=UPI00161312D9|nr:hypothetical protein [Sphingobacterium sp. JUb56]MBB2949350.1 hypothetical protein [Sphingobacterium sp. JUb56]